MPAFEELGLCPELLRVLEEMEWQLPTDVQDESIPLILGGGDVMVAAETGSGKTAAFCLPVLQVVHEALRKRESRELEVDSKSCYGAKKEDREAHSAKDIRMSVDDRDMVFSVSSTGWQCQSRDPHKWFGGRATIGVRGKGKFFYECLVEDEGLCRMGWSTDAAVYDVGTDSNSFGYGSTGKKSHNREFISYGEAFQKNDYIGCYLDLERREISYSKNGKDLGVAFELSTQLKSPLFPAIVLKNAQISLNFGNQSKPVQFPPRQGSGFQLICQARFNESVSRTSNKSDASLHSVATKMLHQPFALILEPARDLAEQVHECCNSFKKYLTYPSITNTLCVGGTSSKTLSKDIQRGCDIVVGTPGKVLDLVESNALQLSSIQFFILDEADRLLETENLDTIMKLYDRMPKNITGIDRLQVCFFSATLHSHEIKVLSEKISQHPVWVDLKGKDSVPSTVHHLVLRINPSDKAWSHDVKELPRTDQVHDFKTKGFELLHRVYNGEKDPTVISEALKLLKPHVLIKLADALEMPQALIFCRTNLDCDLLESYLTRVGGGATFQGKTESGKENRYSCCVLAGMRSMEERRASLKAFKDGDIRFLICTDVAARGIDIKGLPFVVNMTLPDVAENYIHRIGRVGRSDVMGLAISIVAGSGLLENVWYHKCKNRGKGCTNRKLLNQGGCTIWYDESRLLGDIEARLHQPVGEMNAHFQLPDAIQASGGLLQYGKEAAPTEPMKMTEQMRLVKEKAAELLALEDQVQRIWWTQKKYRFD